MVAVVALVGGINVFNAQKSESLSDIALANVEALADDEINPLCPNGCVEGGGGFIVSRNILIFQRLNGNNSKLIRI